MKWHDIKQNTPEWYALRSGKFTASGFKNLFAAENTKAYEKEIYRVVFERLTNERIEDGFQSDYMKRGQELESEALTKYQLTTFNKVGYGGFFEYNEWIGASPDGIIGTDGLVEAKCPAYNTMINYLLKRTLPTEYYWQVYGQLYVTEREWVDFVAYHPALELIILRVFRDKKIINKLEDKLIESIEKVKLTIDEILQKRQ